MPKARTVLALLVTVLLAACQTDDRFRTTGAGASLYTPELAARTRETEDYFGFLCLRAGLVAAATPISPFSETTPTAPAACTVSTPAGWRILVAAGYNDIDKRCDDYLTWLLEKRNQRLFTNQTLAALTTLLGGLTVATGAAEAIGYVGMALGLTATVYNSYHETILNGLEMTTIFKTVESRRTQFRIAFQKVNISSKPDAEYALRSYLRICTPASIIMDANTSALAFAAGETVPPQVRQLENQTKALLGYTPTTPETPVTRIPPRQPIRTPAIAEQVFVGPGWTMNELRTLQAAFCIPEADRGKLGPRTIANINMRRTGSELTASSTNISEKVDSATYGRILDATGGGTCNTSRYQNLNENREYRANPQQEAELLTHMHELSPGGATAAPASFGDRGARDLIGRVRIKCGLNNNRENSFANQVTPDLTAKLAANECGGTSP